jgi:beta-fructofuranosidase
MTLRFEDRWLWDFWLARNGQNHHVFYLQAPKSLGDPELRHWHVSIGHAVSTDLRHWEVLPDALAPAAEPAWDDYTTWTGSVIRHDGRWWMFYTGTSRREEGKIQRIGLATSTDLITWERHGRPLIEADPTWYELFEPASWYEQAWRDPWVFRDERSGTFHAVITARARSGDPDTRGVVGHATSMNLLDWTVEPPITAPGMYGHLEIPQIEQLGGMWRLVFSAPAGPERLWQRSPLVRSTGTHVLSADRPLGPYDWATHRVLVGSDSHDRYGGRLVRAGDGWRLLTWLDRRPDGAFAGELADPAPVTVVEGDLALLSPT